MSVSNCMRYLYVLPTSPGHFTARYYQLREVWLREVKSFVPATHFRRI